MKVITQSAYLQDIKNRFTFYPPVTKVQQENHGIVNAIFIDAAVSLSQICPQSPELETAINYLAIARSMANASLAIYENSKNHQEDDGIAVHNELDDSLPKDNPKDNVKV